MLKKFKIKKRLTVAFVIVALIASVSGSVGVLAMNYMVAQYEAALENNGFVLGDIGRLLGSFSETQSATRVIISYTNAEIIASMVTTHEERKAETQEYMLAVSETLTTAAEVEAYNGAAAAMERYWEIETDIIALGNTTNELKSQQAQTRSSGILAPLYEEAYGYLEQLMELKISEGNSVQASLNTMRVILMLVIEAFIVGSVAMSVFLGGNIARGLANPISALAERMKTFAAGELSSPFPTTDSDDEVADMVAVAGDMASNLAGIIEDAKYRLEEMAAGNYTVSSEVPERYVGEFETLHTSIHDVNEKMNDTLHQISEAADQVSAGSNNLAQASQNLAEGATEQAGAVEELLATITNLTEDINQAAETAEECYADAQNYAGKANQSKEEMQSMVRTMALITENSKKIAGIIGEIEDIASQTNLLSLNASIEAARAGEAGRGFAVVADQIGKLAEESARSAQNTRDLIMNAINEIETGTQVAERTAQSIDDVVEGIQQVAAEVQESSKQSRLQADAMKQAEEGVNQISEVVQANSATAEESSATSEELSAQAQSLDALVRQFKLKD